ncbi:MAG: hypothetical protein V3U74_07735 [Thermodesulfobacteriota bacterium]
MWRMFLPLFIAFGIILYGMSLSRINAEQTNLTGTVTRISVDVMDEGGQYHVILVDDSNVLGSIKVGDSVDINMENGSAVLIEKVDEDVTQADGEYEETDGTESYEEYEEPDEYSDIDVEQEPAPEKKPTVGEAVDFILDVFKKK